MKRNGVEPEPCKRRIFSFFEILSVLSALYGSENRYIMQKFISWYEIYLE